MLARPVPIFISIIRLSYFLSERHFDSRKEGR